MIALIPAAKRLFFGEPSLQASLTDFYNRVQRERPSTATGQPPSTKVQVVERTVTVGRLPDLEEEPTKQPVNDSPLAPPTPTISSVNPSSGSPSGGTSVTIFGSNFIPGASVKFGGIGASSPIVNDSKITCTTPAHSAGQVDVTVENVPDNVDFKVTLTNGFNYQAAPSVSEISPISGDTSGGTTVVITGTNFVDITSVQFGGVNVASFNVINPNRIDCVTPGHGAGVVNVVVTNKFGDSGTRVNAFTYLSSPDYYFWLDGIPAGGVNPTPVGFISGDIKLLRIAAIKNGGTYTDYQGSVNVSTIQIGGFVAFNDNPDIDYPIPVVNGIAQLYIQAFENDPGADTVQSLQFTARDARYSGISGDSPIYGVGNSSHIVGGRKHGGGGSGGVGSLYWADPTVDNTWHTGPFNWIGDRLNNRTLTITMKTAGGATDTSFNGTATVAVTYISPPPSPQNGFSVQATSSVTFHNGVAQIGVRGDYRGDNTSQQSYAYFHLNATSGSVVGSSPTCVILNHLVP